MIVRKHLNPRIVARIAWKRMTLLLVISVTVTLAYRYFRLEHLAIDNMPASVLGIALAILLGFRINSAYERWWEARRLWGAVVNDSRNIARQALSFFSESSVNGITEAEVQFEKKRFLYRQIAFALSLKAHLRRQQLPEELLPFVSEQELERLDAHQNVPNALLQFHAEHLEELVKKGVIDDFRQMQIDTRLTALCDSLGGCERIKNTVFPRQYSYYATLFIAMYSYMLPFIFVDESNWLTIPFTLIIGFIFFALNSIANGVENPFENNFNDTPMSALCRTIEINLKQMLKEEGIPEAVQPVNGFLF